MDTRIVEAPIIEVVLMEDRARIVREVNLNFSSGDQKIKISGVTPILVDRTLTAYDRQGQIQINDIFAERKKLYKGESRNEELQKLRQEMKQLKKEERKYKDGLMLLNDQLGFYLQQQEFLLGEIQLEVSSGNADSSGWQQQYDTLEAEKQKYQKQIQEKRVALSRISEKKKNLEMRESLVKSPADVEISEILLEMTVPEKGSKTINIEYVVPNACWRPHYVANLKEASEEEIQLKFEAFACVWQNTGEDWQNVKLQFSTERASLGTKPPELENDFLSAKPKGAEVVEMREEEIHQSGLGQSSSSSREIAGINDQGQLCLISAAENNTVKSDGRPVKIKMYDFSSELVIFRILNPGLVEQVVICSKQSNKGTFPVFEGPVDLVRRGSFIGRTKVKYTAPGESFELSWGPDGDVVCNRQLDLKTKTEGAMGNWTRDSLAIENSLSNLGNAEKEIILTERVPVSEVEKVQIQIDKKKTSKHKMPDKNGFVQWRISLKPYDHQKIKLHYSVKHHYSIRMAY